MPKPLPRLDALHAFESAARLQSFKLAAAELHLTATAISHRIRKLEDDLGRALFTRRVRAVTLTPEGQQLLTGVQTGLNAIATAVASIRHPARQVVTLSVTPELAAQWLVPRLAELRKCCPDVDLHVHASYDTADLNGGAADLAIRYGSGPFSGVDASPLFQERFAPVASPRLKARLPKDPARWPLIHMEWYRRSNQAFDWKRWAGAAGVDAATVASGTRYSQGSHAVQAAIAGQGVALLGLALLEDELRLNLLQIVAEPVLDAPFYHVCTPSRRASSAAALQVRAWLLQQCHRVDQAPDELPPAGSIKKARKMQDKSKRTP